jgi:hypothetical protein
MAVTASAFPRRAQAFYERRGMTVEALLTDTRLRSITIAMPSPARARNPAPANTPRRPQTNGKAGHFIRTCSPAD